MKLPFFNTKPQVTDSPKEVFWVLKISASRLQSALCLGLDQQKTEILSQSGEVEWHIEDPQSLIQATDKAISQIMEFLPEDMDEPEKILLGIPAEWVKDGQPQSTYRDLLKNLVHELDLKAMGFAVVSEAVINYLNQQESVP